MILEGFIEQDEEVYIRDYFIGDWGHAVWGRVES